jgi:predicted metal-binding membrane protein
MWIMMTAAMMLPSLIPMLRTYRRAIARPGAVNLPLLTGVAAAGYFVVWSAIGAALFPFGVVVAALEMNHAELESLRPFVVGAVVSIAGAYQLTKWKARHLACCRSPVQARSLPGDFRTAWQQGVRLGAHCVRCCANLMVIAIVLGMMDPPVMVVLGGAITLERVAPAGDRIARWTGATSLIAGLLLVIRALP